ncbi:MAG: hypothetical protein Ct9H300mP16_17570 [Pseudomonadota bacterium]|nr:MAG: hypothetical protein Ct9H300mP16_17570 [Pseudomonadota bacterium]
MLGLAHTWSLKSFWIGSFLIGVPRVTNALKAICSAKPMVSKNSSLGSLYAVFQPRRSKILPGKWPGSRTLITGAWSLQRANMESNLLDGSNLGCDAGPDRVAWWRCRVWLRGDRGIGVPLKRLPRPSLSRGHNAVSDFLPVARIADMLLNPGQPYSFNGNQSSYPDIRLVYWCGGNPFHHHQDLNRLREAWKQPETVIVHEPWWTATAKHSDIVFPATTPYEREDIARSATDSFLFHMPELIPPLNDARDDYQIFSELRRGFILTRYSPKAVTQMLGYGICIKDSNVTALIRELTCLITFVTRK